MKLKEKIQAIIEKNEDCEIELGGELKIHCEIDGDLEVEICYEQDDDCIIIGLRKCKEENGRYQYASKAYDIEDMTELMALKCMNAEII